MTPPVGTGVGAPAAVAADALVGALRVTALLAESSALERQLIDLLTVFVIAAAVGVFVAKVGRFPYTIALLLAGFGASLIGVGIDLPLTHDIILLVVLPPLLFEGAATTDVDEFRRSLPTIATLAVVGLAVSILVVGAATALLPTFGFELLIALLFATIVLPTDPVSVLAMFERLGVPERLSVLVEGESLINDGVAVVVFSALLVQIESGAAAAQLATPSAVGAILAGIAVKSLGGAAVGFVAGYAVYRVMITLDDHMTEIVLTVVLAYGAFLAAEHYIGVSGVIATVVSGLFIGNRGREYAMSPQTKIAVFNTWETAAFVVNTFIFVLLGVKTPLGQILNNADLLVPAIVLVVLARAVAVYPLTELANLLTGPDVPREFQHVMVWGGLHGSIPIALVLGLPDAIPAATRETLRVLVFGVAAFSLVVQGLTMSRLIDRLGIATTGEEKRLYELLMARARAVDEALEEAERLNARNEIGDDVHERFRTEYGEEKADLGEAIARLLAENPRLRRQEALRGERRVLRSEESAIREAELSGQVSTDVAEDLLDEVRLKQDWLADGRTTVTGVEDEEGYEEFWRERARDVGILDADAEDDAEDDGGVRNEGDRPEPDPSDPDSSPMD